MTEEYYKALIVYTKFINYASVNTELECVSGIFNTNYWKALSILNEDDDSEEKQLLLLFLIISTGAILLVIIAFYIICIRKRMCSNKIERTSEMDCD